MKRIDLNNLSTHFFIYFLIIKFKESDYKIKKKISDQMGKAKYPYNVMIFNSYSILLPFRWMMIYLSTLISKLKY